jgi:NADPH2:quinone reductase
VPPHPITRFDWIDAEGPCSLAALGAELFELMAAGKMQPRIGLVLPLSDASGAHDALEQRRTTGKILLSIPQ